MEPLRALMPVREVAPSGVTVHVEPFFTTQRQMELRKAKLRSGHASYRAVECQSLKSWYLCYNILSALARCTPVKSHK